jgi:hypothetical protein
VRIALVVVGAKYRVDKYLAKRPHTYLFTHDVYNRFAITKYFGVELSYSLISFWNGCTLRDLLSYHIAGTQNVLIEWDCMSYLGPCPILLHMPGWAREETLGVCLYRRFKPTWK